MRAMANALNQNLSRRSAAYAKSSNAAAGRLGKPHDVLPETGAAAQTVRAKIVRQTHDAEKIGTLSARFESGAEGIAAIGYDQMGGTSYGKYQIASRPGSMEHFLRFLDAAAPDVSAKLRAAGPANTGGRKGRMPAAWREIAEQEPDRFAELQERFIRDSHYAPALEAVRRAGFNTEEFSPALKEVLWSTAVQHGPHGAAKIFIRAAEQADASRPGEKDVIRNVYASRAKQFTSSTESVRTAVQQRLRQEQRLALSMTEGGRIRRS